MIMTDIRGSSLKSHSEMPQPKRLDGVEADGIEAGIDGASGPAIAQNNPTISASRSMGVNYSPEFVTAIRPGAEREPEWFVMRFITGKERLLRRLLDQTRLPYHHLTFEHRQRRRPPTERAWLPGHMFIHFDRRRDFWQQILHMPAVLEILGDPSPLPVGMMEDLVGRLPNRVAKASAFSTIPPGQTIRIIRGPVAGFECVVTWSDRRHVKVISMMFGRPTELILKIEDVLVIA